MNKFLFLFITALSIQFCIIMNCKGGEVLLFCSPEVLEEVNAILDTIIQSNTTSSESNISLENTTMESQPSQDQISLP